MPGGPASGPKISGPAVRFPVLGNLGPAVRQRSDFWNGGPDRRSFWTAGPMLWKIPTELYQTDVNLTDTSLGRETVQFNHIIRFQIDLNLKCPKIIDSLNSQGLAPSRFSINVRSARFGPQIFDYLSHSGMLRFTISVLVAMSNCLITIWLTFNTP